MKNIKHICGLALGGLTVLGLISYANDKRKTAKKYEDLSNKHFLLYQLMNEWVNVKQEGKGMADYFINNHYDTIAIYGMNIVGKTMLKELSDSSIKVAYAIDRQADRIVIPNLIIKKPEDELPNVDAIIVTPITFFEEIERDLEKKCKCPIISIEDIIYDI